MVAIKVVSTDRDIRIYLDDLLHVAFSRTEIDAIHSYIDDRPAEPWPEFKNRYVIKFITTRSYFETEYEDRQVWEGILKELDRQL